MLVDFAEIDDRPPLSIFLLNTENGAVVPASGYFDEISLEEIFDILLNDFLVSKWDLELLCEDGRFGVQVDPV